MNVIKNETMTSMYDQTEKEEEILAKTKTLLIQHLVFLKVYNGVCTTLSLPMLMYIP